MQLIVLSRSTAMQLIVLSRSRAVCLEMAQVGIFPVN